jgi:NTP pyrophosphatase (non-canonical NTP hydrolase)
MTQEKGKYREAAIESVVNEMERQLIKWGVQSHDDPIWLTILTEETGEVAEAILDDVFHPGKTPCRTRDEVIQVAAVALSWLTAIFREWPEANDDAQA